MPSLASSASRRTIANPIPGTPSRHLPLAEISASMPLPASVIGSAPNEHRVDDQPLVVAPAHGGDVVERVQDAGARLQMHLRDMRDARLACERGFERGRIDGRVLAERQCDRFDTEPAEDLQDARAVRAVVGTSTTPSRGTSVPSAASTENVPLPCIGTHTYSSPPCAIVTRSAQTLAVS